MSAMTVVWFCSLFGTMVLVSVVTAIVFQVLDGKRYTAQTWSSVASMTLVKEVGQLVIDAAVYDGIMLLVVVFERDSPSFAFGPALFWSFVVGLILERGRALSR